MHIYPLLVIVTGLLVTSCGGVVNTTETYDICSGSRYNNLRITAASYPFIIRSQGVGVANYSNNLDCSLVLKSGTQPLLMSFEFRVFSLETSPSCGYDSLCLKGVQFCGSSFNGSRFNYIFPGNKDFTVYFHTDHSVNMSGFQILVTTSPLAEGQRVNQPAGRGNDLSGIYFVNTTYYSGFPYSDGCVQYLPRATITPSISTDDNNEISTTTLEAAATTQEPRYNAYYLCSSQQLTTYISTRSSPFLILSPNYGSGYYVNSQYCSLLMRSGPQPLVLHVDIKDFQVESHDTCVWDSLCVGGATFCGQWLTRSRLDFILPEYSTFTISFLTDGSEVGRGFKIEVSQELATSQIVYQPRSGIVSNNGTITYTNERYRPGYPYSDRCARPSSMTPATTATSTTTPGPDVCYSAAHVRELNEVLDQAIAGLNRAKRLLIQRK
ncbi:hypothetical protein BsWGS_21948 [Bradybaena similaris]